MQESRLAHDAYAAWCGKCKCNYCKKENMLTKYISNSVAVLTDSIKEVDLIREGHYRIILCFALDQNNDLYWYVDMYGTCYWLDEGIPADFEGHTDAEAVAFFRTHWGQS
jgi:hypothetical protein